MESRVRKQKEEGGKKKKKKITGTPRFLDSSIKFQYVIFL